MDFSNACRNVPSAWTETSNSYLVCRNVNTHTGIERCVMYLSSFHTFPSILNPRTHIAHTTHGRPFEASVVFQAKRSPPRIVNNN